MSAAARPRWSRPSALALVQKAFSPLRPPVERYEFWAVQVLVVAIALVHSWLEASHTLDAHTPIYLVPTSLFLVPILYAALNFGLHGSALTAVWCAALSVPNILLLHDGLEQWGELLQLGWLSATAVFVGSRVDRERTSRLDAERREDDRRISEERYRAIYDTVSEPIVLLDDEGRVEEANAAAAEMFSRPVADLRGHPLPAPLGPSIMASLRTRPGGGSDASDPIRLPKTGAWIEPIGAAITDPLGRAHVQIVLRDVTAQHERERGLEGIARQTLAAREAEQRRIARELHDGPVQSLVLLVRKLDGLEALVPAGTTTLGDARAIAESVTDELRRVSRDLRPSILDDLGLPAALQSLSHVFTGRTGVKARVVLSGRSRRLSTELELTLLRIAEEALRNVERHSGAANVVLRLAFTAKGTRLMIADDGEGMEPIPSPSELLSSNRFGLIGMEERARLAGATLSLRSRPHDGLVVEVDARTEGSMPEAEAAS
ncbi:MAG: histidine kinase [Candidatus Limnocylindrales bacterium]|nr:histidine kinase [Candidatus Limnocylindrales bacterium]